MSKRIRSLLVTAVAALGIAVVAAPASAAPASFASIVVCGDSGDGEPVTFGFVGPAVGHVERHRANIQSCLDHRGTVIEESDKRVPPLL